jgi:4-amino-4-deoxy-L-arabinose transferase-like glycosyltransferase
MKTSRTSIIFNDVSLLILLAFLVFFLHLLTNGQYGFHRDELATLDDAHYLAWGYIAYPPVTPFIGRVALELFGLSLIGVRLFSSLALSVAMVLAGLMARELGGSRFAQVVTLIAVATAPIVLIQGALFQYVSFDYLWSVMVAYCVIRLLKSDNPRWWLGIGAGIGLGMMTKYNMAFFVVGIVGGVMLTRARRYLTSPWLWGGVLLSLLIFLPNLLWQIQHHFISLDFLRTIHVRDIGRGRTQGFLLEQLFAPANLFTIPLWVAGLYYYLFNRAGARYRMLGWMFLLTFALYLILQGRSYYLSPAYPMLIAAGAVVLTQWLAALSVRMARLGRGVIWGMLVLGAALSGALMLPIAPINSTWWQVVSKVHDNFVEELGWPELVKTVADIYGDLPTAEQAQTGILTGNYGEAGAINLLGSAYSLPQAISGIDSYWLRGYGDSPPQTLIVLGYVHEGAELFFERCEVAGRITNRYDIENEEIRFHPDIFICRGPRQPWPILWQRLKHFG